MTASSTPVTQGAHLVGSVNLADAASVMTAAATHLGDRLRRVPDGEVGERYYWIQFQRDRLAAADGISRVGEPGSFLRGEFDARPLGLDDGVDAASLELPALGYADAALGSYEAFRDLRDRGVIAFGTRFQVSLPTPAAVIASFIVPADRAALEPVYERALFGELDRILAGIPHDDLAIQWDTAAEFGLLESDRLPAGFPLVPWFEDVLDGVVQRAVRQASAVPARVEVGYHLCYGDVEEAHFVQPEDAGTLTAFAAGLLAGSPRPITWLHLPVPIDRDDAAYFAPLADLDVPDDTELYLGLIHHEDGIEGALRRIRAAHEAQPRFGVATECGFGRGPAERTEPLLDLHAPVTDGW
jgi:Methionine synthase II (cobalamin-independent)